MSVCEDQKNGHYQKKYHKEVFKMFDALYTTGQVLATWNELSLDINIIMMVQIHFYTWVFLESLLSISHTFDM